MTSVANFFLMQKYIEYFDDFGMQIPKDVGTSSPSISPIQQDEDPVLSFPSGSYYVSGHAQSFNDYSYYAPQAYHHSGLDNYPSLMYPDSSVDPPPLMLLDSSTNSIPSPTSTLSSSSVHNFAMGGPMYLNSTKDCPSYSSVFYYTEGSHHEDDHKNISEAPSCCSRANGSSNKEKEFKKESTKSKETSGGGKKHSYNKRHTREKGKKRCSNCYSNNSPSWRRSVSDISKGDLLCNACGL